MEKGRGDRIVAKLDGVIWRTDHQRIKRQLARAGSGLSDNVLEDAQEIRCRGDIDFYPPAGRLQLIVRELDAAFALGELERRRRETLLALQQADLLERNRRLEIGRPPLRLGLVTSDGSAAQRDVLSSLAGSGYGFRVLFVHAAVQGRGAEQEIAEALSLLGAARPGGEPLDAVLLVRGGGSRTDLAAFDSRAVAFAVARSSLPVICGLGHEIDQTIADRVAHTSLTTPTKAAERMVEEVAAVERELDALQEGLIAGAERRIQAARFQLSRGERVARLGGQALAQERRRLHAAAGRLETSFRQRLSRLAAPIEHLASHLAGSAERLLERRWTRLDELPRSIAKRASAGLETRRAELDAAARLLAAHDPTRLLERGYSLTYDGQGRLLTVPDQVRSGDLLRTRLRGGDLQSRVESTDTEKTAEKPSREARNDERDS